MRLRHLWLASIAFSLCTAESSFGQPTVSEVKALVAENLAATEAGDLDRILATIHSESFSRSAIPAAMKQLKDYKLRYETTKVEFIVMSGEYALVRVVQRTTRLSGPAFQDNELDGIWALRKENGKWKYWSQMVLGLKALAPSPQP